MLGLLFPVATAILPLFIKIRDLGLLDSYWGIVLPQVAFSLAMSILLLRVAFKQLPTELLDAAMMDGCGYFRYFFFITLPLSGPVLSTVAIISFVGSWNGYLLPLVVLNSESRYPWTLGPYGLSGPVHDLLATRTRIHHFDDFARDPDIPSGSALYRRRPYGRRCESLRPRRPSFSIKAFHTRSAATVSEPRLTIDQNRARIFASCAARGSPKAPAPFDWTSAPRTPPVRALLGVCGACLVRNNIVGSFAMISSFEALNT